MKHAFLIGSLLTLFGGLVMARDHDAAAVYMELRNQVLDLSADQVAPDDGVLAVLMETGYPEAVATLVAVADGTASLYFSNGGIIGAGAYAQVSDEARGLVQVAKAQLATLGRADDHSLPGLGVTRFYVVTDAGVFSGEAPEADLGAESHALSPLFLQGHKLIAHIRAADEHRRGAGSEE